MMVKSCEAWVKPVWDTIKARDPGMPFAMVNNWGFPMRPVLAPLWNQYNDFFMGGTLVNGRVGLNSQATLQEATDHMNWLYPLVPKPHISNFYLGAQSADSCVYYQTASGGSIGVNVNQGLATYDRLVNIVMPFKVAELDIAPHVGWMRWEFSDNPSESGWPHWGVGSLNDNLYGGWDFTFPQADPFATDRQIATEDFHYSDMLGFGGTIPPTLQRTDLIVGANIALKNVFIANMGDTPTPPPPPPPPEEFMAVLNAELTLELQQHETAYSGMRIRFQRSTDGGATWANVQSNVRAIGTTDDSYGVPVGQSGQYRAGAALTDGTVFGTEVFSNVAQVAVFEVLTPTTITLSIA
jgi:hypothetical protein